MVFKGKRKIPASSTDTAGCSSPRAVEAEVEMMEKSDLSHLPEGTEFWISTENKTSSTSGLSQKHLSAPSQSDKAFKTPRFPTCMGMLRQPGIFRYKSRTIWEATAPTRCLAPPRSQLCCACVAFVSERALETHLGNQDHAQLPRHSSSCIPQPFFQDQSLLLPVFGGGVRVNFIEEPLGLVQGVRARPGPSPKKHQQVLVDHQCGPSLGRGVGTWQGERKS